MTCPQDHTARALAGSGPCPVCGVHLAVVVRGEIVGVGGTLGVILRDDAIVEWRTLEQTVRQAMACGRRHELAIVSTLDEPTAPTVPESAELQLVRGGTGT